MTKHTPRSSLRILGSRGIPASYGGFETFAEDLALYLVQRGWRVTVYCQERGRGRLWESTWHGVRLIHVPVWLPEPLAAIAYDWRATWHAAASSDTVLTLGYNTALFSALLRLAGTPHLMNTDGLEWQRPKWPWWARAWLRANEAIGCIVANQLVADHPEIMAYHSQHVPTAKLTMIPYGADELLAAPEDAVRRLGLLPGSYALVVARSVPDNSILEIVTAFSRRERGIKLAVVGRYEPDKIGYHRAVIEAASPEVVFPGPIYRPDIASIRFHAALYIHGHTVGGTNPSLVESLAAGNPVLAIDNPYNRWVAGPMAARYFRSIDDCDQLLATLLGERSALREMGAASRERHRELFTQERVLGQYEVLLMTVAGSARQHARRSDDRTGTPGCTRGVT